MALRVYGNAAYNGQVVADGTVCTPANTGASTVNAGTGFGGSTAIWRSTTEFGGTLAIEVSNVSGQPANLRFPYTAQSITASYAVDFTMPPLPDSGSITPFTQRISNAAVVLFQALPSGQFNILAGISGNQTSLPAPTPPSGTGTPAALVAGTKYRVEILVTGNSGANTGTVSVYLFPYGAANSAYIARTTSTTVVLAASGSPTTPLTHADIGMQNNTLPRSFRFSNVRMVDGSAALQGPFVAATPEFDINVNFSPTSGNSPVNAQAVVSRVSGTGTGNTMTVFGSWGDGTTIPTTSAPGGTVTLSHTYTAATPTDYNWSITATLDA